LLLAFLHHTSSKRFGFVEIANPSQKKWRTSKGVVDLRAIEIEV
jgi:hypothetical protein